jgi:hypothetical protein
LYNPDIVASNYGNFVLGQRWDDQYVTQPDVNPDGIGEEALAHGAAAFLLASGGLKASNDGSDTIGTLDEMYDQTNGAFLVQSITLEALSGSGGQSTGIVLYVGNAAFSLDNLAEASFLTFGLGENEVANYAVGETDGTTHATITIAAQGPSALVVSAGAGVRAEIAASVDRGQGNNIHVRPRVIQSAGNDLDRLSLQAADVAIGEISDVRAVRRAIRGSRALVRAEGVVDFATLNQLT